MENETFYGPNETCLVWLLCYAQPGCRARVALD